MESRSELMGLCVSDTLKRNDQKQKCLLLQSINMVGPVNPPHDDEEEEIGDLHISICRIRMPCAICGEEHEFIATEAEYYHVIGGGMLLKACFRCVHG